MKTLSDLPPDAWIQVRFARNLNGDPEIWVSLKGSLGGHVGLEADNPQKPKESFWFSGQVNCERAPGWGPLLYDIAMELATKYGKGLSPTPGPSKEARKVWQHYYEKRANKEPGLQTRPHTHATNPDLDEPIVNEEDLPSNVNLTPEVFAQHSTPRPESLKHIYTKTPNLINHMDNKGTIRNPTTIPPTGGKSKD